MNKKILFKINGEVVYIEDRDLEINGIEKMKGIIAEELECQVDDINLDYIDTPELSEIDVTLEGLVYWKSLFMIPLTGVEILLVLGSDEHLDAILNGTIEDYLIIK